MDNNYIKTSLDKLMKNGMTRTEALIFLKKITVARISLLSRTSDTKGEILDSLLQELANIESLLQGIEK